MLMLLVGGCGNVDGPANGVVRFTDGEPLQSGSIEFRSLNDGSRYAARVDRDGSFSLKDRVGDDRLPPGPYEVVVVQIVLTEDLAADQHRHGRTAPRRYADYYTSGLRFSNEVNRTDPIQIELETEP